jgi:hypothetical protein
MASDYEDLCVVLDTLVIQWMIESRNPVAIAAAFGSCAGRILAALRQSLPDDSTLIAEWLANVAADAMQDFSPSDSDTRH